MCCLECCIPCLLCEAASCACSCTTSVCGKLVFWPKIAARALYTIVYFVFVVVSWIFRVYAHDILDGIPVVHACDEERCSATVTVYRFSFILCIFHIILGLLTIGVKEKSEWRHVFQDALWHIKLLFLVGGVVITFLIPNDVFRIYGWIAMAGAAIFVLIQLVFLVDFVHSLAENWVSKYHESQDKRWYALLLTCTGFCYVSVFIASVLMYVYFDCPTSVAFVTINIILGIVTGITSVHPKVQEKNEHSGLLQASFIMAYCTYLIYAALSSNPHASCNPFYTEQLEGATNISVFFGAFFSIIAVVYATVRTADKVDHASSSESTKEGPVDYNYSLFHVAFALGAMYIAMLMSDWYTISNSDTKDVRVDTGLGAMWVKVGTSWLAFVLYEWTLLGPVLFPDRDWSTGV